MKIIILINDTTYAYNLRGAIIRRLISLGHEVVVVGQLLDHQQELREMGCRLIGVETDRHGINPLDDIKLMMKYRSILKKEKPGFVLTYNIKPNVYGGMSCRMLHIPFIPNVTGLGKPVENPGKLQLLSMKLYQMGVAGAKCVFFQNEDNRHFFLEHGLLKTGAATRVIPGSGVDLPHHPYLPYPKGDTVRFLFAARIMKEKGIDLFLAAARKYASDDVIFDVCGACDDEHYLSLLQNEACIHYHGQQADMVPFYRDCSCFLYPSYYPEGMSNVLLEASACGRPVVAADRCGCRQTVDDGKSGYLVPVNDESAVLAAVGKFLSLTAEQRETMGKAARAKVEKEFDRELVVNAYIEELFGH